MKLTLALSLLLVASPALAGEEPKGFAEFLWGTSREEMKEKFLGPKCSGRMPPDEELRPMCPGYRLDGIGSVMLGLDFSIGTLQGYSIIVPAGKAFDFSVALDEKFGKPKTGGKASDHISMWSWPSGTTATYLERSPLGGWLIVATKKSTDPSVKESQRQRDKIKKAF